MDTRTTMILANEKPISSDISHYTFNDLTQKWDITFKNGRTFHYSAQNIVILKNPIILEPSQYRIRKSGKIFDHISAIYGFNGISEFFLHICFSTGYEQDYKVSDLQIQTSALAHKDANHIFEYLKEVANFISIRTEDGTAILANEYQKIDFLDKSTAAAAYLNPAEFHPEPISDSPTLVFPFGCNKSQFQAVSNALSNRISIIEGPPGTGKTQTILNIIANLVLQGKTVQVVSNNNSAIENIVEKLESPQYSVGFIAALLGRSERKEAFISNQTGNYPDFTPWNDDAYTSPEFLDDLQTQSQSLQEIFHLKNELAHLQQEQRNLQLEKEHHDRIYPFDPAAYLNLKMKKTDSGRIMEFWQEYQDIQDGAKKVSLLYRFICRFAYGIRIGAVLKLRAADVLAFLQNQYYTVRLTEIASSICEIEQKLQRFDADSLMRTFTEQSLHYFQVKLAKRYLKNHKRPVFTKKQLSQAPNHFLQEYPVVLSTTYTARSSLGARALFDYVIMDEASQGDVATGFLALSCAANAVIVGDTCQLSNVVVSAQKGHLNDIFAKHNIPQAYNYTEYSFLRSLRELMGEQVPQVTLCEHYRCHPQIIDFCNQKFYHGDLILMTSGNDQNALELVTTVAGNHARDRSNQRQADVIKKEILPRLNCPKTEIGIISPYRNQISVLQKTLNEPEIDIATVHKFQGREKDVIILSTVDDIVTSFSDDPTLVNVAVSRAKKRLIVVASEMEQPFGSNIRDLIDYIRYHNCDIRHSEIRSVFDYLYSQYEESRLIYLKKHRRISEYDSENLMFALIMEELAKRTTVPLSVVCHQPLNLLIRDTSKLTDEEKRFVDTGLSHLDFLIFNKVSKQPLLAIEVDGFHYHKENSKQAERDKLKNHIMEVYHIPLLRFSTNGSGEAEKLSSALNDLLCSQKI